MSAQPLQPPDAAEVLMDPHARLTASLVVSLILWAPFGMAAMRSDLELVDAGIRYLVAFVGCRIAIGGIAHLIASYRSLQDGATAPAQEQAPARTAAPAAAAAPTAPRNRRKEDAAQDEATTADAPPEAGRPGGPGRI